MPCLYLTLYTIYCPYLQNHSVYMLYSIIVIHIRTMTCSYSVNKKVYQLLTLFYTIKLLSFVIKKDQKGTDWASSYMLWNGWKQNVTMSKNLQNIWEPSIMNIVDECLTCHLVYKKETRKLNHQ